MNIWGRIIIFVLFIGNGEVKKSAESLETTDTRTESLMEMRSRLMAERVRAMQVEKEVEKASSVGVSEGSEFLRSEQGARTEEEEVSIAPSTNTTLVSAEKDLSPLSLAVSNYDGPESVEKIIKELEKAKEADTINQQSQPNGRTALMDLVERVPEDVLLGAPGGGEPGLLQRFLDAGADPNLEDAQGQSAFLITVRERKYSVALRFLHTTPEAFEDQMSEAISMILRAGSYNKSNPSMKELLEALIDSLRKIPDTRKWQEWVQKAVIVSDVTIVDLLLIRFINLLGVKLFLARSLVLWTKEEVIGEYNISERFFSSYRKRFQPLLDAALAIADREKKDELQAYFIEKGASRESSTYGESMEEEKQHSFFRKRNVYEEHEEGEMVRGVEHPTPLMKAAQQGNVKKLIQAYNEAPKELGTPTEERGDTALHFAVRENHKDCVRLLIEWGADPSAINDDSVSAIEEAMEQKDPKLLEELLRGEGSYQVSKREWIKLYELIGTGEEVKIIDKFVVLMNLAESDLGVFLLYAAQEGHLEICALLLARGALVDQTNNDGDTSLHVAAFRGHHKICDLLLKYESNVNQARINGATPLIIAAQEGNLAVCELLLERGAAVDQARDNGATALYIAVEKVKLQVCKLLLERGATVDQADEYGFTPLYMAAQIGCYELCELLLGYKASVTQCDDEGVSPLFIGAQNGHVEVCALLLDNGAKVDQADDEGDTPLIIAAQNGHVEVCAVLLDNGATVDQAVDGGVSPLFIAAQEGHVEVCALLLDNGATVDQADDEGVSPLFIAAQNSHNKVCEILLANGATVDKADNDGITPLFIASKAGHGKACECLIFYGADIANLDPPGRNALNLAAEILNDGFLSVEEEEKYVAIFSLLMEEQEIREHLGYAEVVGHGKNKMASLALAAQKGEVELGRRILSRRIEVDKRSPVFQASFYWAILRGDVSFVELLLEVGATPKINPALLHEGDRLFINGFSELNDYNALTLVERILSISQIQRTNLELYGNYLKIQKILSNHQKNEMIRHAISSEEPELGQQPSLLEAARTNDFGMCMTLLKSGADVDAVNAYNSTALTIAAELGYVDIVRLLLGYNANIDHTDNHKDTALGMAMEKSGDDELFEEEHERYIAIIDAIVDEKKRRLELGSTRLMENHIRELREIRDSLQKNKEEEKEGKSDEESSVTVKPLEEAPHHYGAGAGAGSFRPIEYSKAELAKKKDELLAVQHHPLLLADRVTVLKAGADSAAKQDQIDSLLFELGIQPEIKSTTGEV